MTRTLSESPYRTARRAFICACQSQGVDVITRVHPIPGPDGKPLFQDTAALGDRNATRALVLICETVKGSAVFANLVQDEAEMRLATRLVFVHGFDPLAFAAIGKDRSWSLEMLKAIAREDIAKVKKLAILSEGPREGLAEATHSVLDQTRIAVAALPLGETGWARAVIAQTLSSL